ncbi:MAG: hypothetical protein JHD07_08900 [Bradyrhizobium sp.]|uniref:hypothetical protein n=1 Tax=Bradyrhizobium sp. TaxID=376 RepID=UPI001A244843|nr:hypothetical protein [Bradyrhizobium sp.]MBJ7403396.1 hypothetical protein [Bradyrhizobium sp.]
MLRTDDESEIEFRKGEAKLPTAMVAEILGVELATLNSWLRKYHMVIADPDPIRRRGRSSMFSLLDVFAQPGDASARE